VVSYRKPLAWPPVAPSWRWRQFRPRWLQPLQEARQIQCSASAHKQIMETVRATAAEIRHSTEDEAIALEKGVFTEQNSDELDLFIELTEAVPTTLLGVVALVTHLDEVNKTDPWKFEDNYATPLIGALAKAFNRMAVAHRV
jgi:hypothetical protein